MTSSLLGSITFWAAYFIIGSFVGTITLKYIAEDSFEYLTKGIMAQECATQGYIILVIVHYLLWPIILAGWLSCILCILIVKYITIYIVPIMRKWVLAIDKITTFGDNKKND